MSWARASTWAATRSPLPTTPRMRTCECARVAPRDGTERALSRLAHVDAKGHAKLYARALTCGVRDYCMLVGDFWRFLVERREMLSPTRPWSRSSQPQSRAPGIWRQERPFWQRHLKIPKILVAACKTSFTLWPRAPARRRAPEDGKHFSRGMLATAAAPGVRWQASSLRPALPLCTRRYNAADQCFLLRCHGDGRYGPRSACHR